jgi:hypothetical protein
MHSCTLHYRTESPAWRRHALTWRVTPIFAANGRESSRHTGNTTSSSSSAPVRHGRSHRAAIRHAAVQHKPSAGAQPSSAAWRASRRDAHELRRACARNRTGREVGGKDTGAHEEKATGKHREAGGVTGGAGGGREGHGCARGEGDGKAQGGGMSDGGRGTGEDGADACRRVLELRGERGEHVQRADPPRPVPQVPACARMFATAVEVFKRVGGGGAGGTRARPRASARSRATR